MDCAISSTGEAIAFGGSGGYAHLWSSASAQQLVTVNRFCEVLHTPAFSRHIRADVTLHVTTTFLHGLLVKRIAEVQCIACPARKALPLQAAPCRGPPTQAAFDLAVLARVTCAAAVQPLEVPQRRPVPSVHLAEHDSFGVVPELFCQNVMYTAICSRPSSRMCSSSKACVGSAIALSPALTAQVFPYDESFTVESKLARKQGKPLSAFDGAEVISAGLPPRGLHPSVLTGLRQVDFVGYATNPRAQRGLPRGEATKRVAAIRNLRRSRKAAAECEPICT